MNVWHIALAICVASEVPICENKDETAMLQGVVKHHNRRLEQADVAEAWTFLFPLVVMDATRGRNPPNMMLHSSTLADPSMTKVVKPNVDTLYSALWFDLPDQTYLRIQVPVTGERFYLWQFMDMFSNTFKSLGGGPATTKQNVFLVGPNYTDTGSLPTARTFRSPTRSGFAITRILCNGPDDVSAVRKLQRKFKVKVFGGTGAPAAHPSSVSGLTLPPPERVQAMSAQEFFERAADLMAAGNKPKEDIHQPMVQKLLELGLYPFKWDELESDEFLIEQGVNAAKHNLNDMEDPTAPTDCKACWSHSVESIGNFGDQYSLRAYFALTALGVNIPADAFYPQNSFDSKSEQLKSDKIYTMTFDPTPPVNDGAFWSLTAYGPENYLIENENDVYAVGDRSDLVQTEDGKTIIYLSPERPADAPLANWLPTPADHTDFSLTLRLYSPKPQALDGTWVPPLIIPQGS